MTSIGIDLGTTNSCISFSQPRLDGSLVASPLQIPRVTGAAVGLDGRIAYSRGQAATLPSCVFYDRKDILVGDYAKAQVSKYPEQVVCSVKSQMGAPTVRGLAPGLPDRTPSQVSSRILGHMLKLGEKILRERISTCVIAVPASFDAAQRIATLEAAELAGLKVRHEDGRWVQMLISEPEAVLYDVANRVQNGEIPMGMLNLAAPKRLLIFDIGGGTLDVSLHEVERDTLRQRKLNIKNIAISRYTRLAGDDFDAIVADALFERYLKRLETIDPGSVSRVRANRAQYERTFLTAAEQLKINLSNKISAGTDNGNFDFWFDAESAPADEQEEVRETISCMLGDGFVYNDTITRSEYEAMISPLMGDGLNCGDWRRAANLSAAEQRTVIAPILDVLAKAHRYCPDEQLDNFAIDAVILNGGMSRHYLIRDRLEQFFGFAPITVSDPDLSVANGAAIFAHYLANGDVDRIEVTRHIQNETLWLGLGRGAVECLIEEGTELPHQVTVEGYRVAAGTKSFELPLKGSGGASDRLTLARGVVKFERALPYATELRLHVSFDRSGLINARAELYLNQTILAVGTLELTIGAGLGEHTNAERIMPKAGAMLNAANEISSLKLLCTAAKADNASRINARINTITACGNPRDFERPILGQLHCGARDDRFRACLYMILPELVPHWSEAACAELRELCRGDIVGDDLYCMVGAHRRAMSDHAKAVWVSLCAS